MPGPGDHGNPDKRIGLLAGWGRYPLVVAEALAGQGYATYCLGVKGHADPALARLCQDFDWVGLARLGHAINYYRRHGVRQATMVGKIHKFQLFHPWVWFKHLPDWRAVKRFYRHFILQRHNQRDDTLLKAIVDEFAAAGIQMAPATDFVPELLAEPGPLTRRAPTATQELDIRYGWKLAKTLGSLDVGQSVAIKGEVALAVEAVEGTDECIRRAGRLCPAGGVTIVKVAKPQQDMRFDVPTIGAGTLAVMAEAGATCLAVEARRTIVVDQEEVVRLAELNKIAVVAFDGADCTTPETGNGSRER